MNIRDLAYKAQSQTPTVTGGSPGVNRGSFQALPAPIVGTNTRDVLTKSGYTDAQASQIISGAQQVQDRIKAVQNIDTSEFSFDELGEYDRFVDGVADRISKVNLLSADGASGIDSGLSRFSSIQNQNSRFIDSVADFGKDILGTPFRAASAATADLNRFLDKANGDDLLNQSREGEFKKIQDRLSSGEITRSQAGLLQSQYREWQEPSTFTLQGALDLVDVVSLGATSLARKGAFKAAGTSIRKGARSLAGDTAAATGKRLTTTANSSLGTAKATIRYVDAKTPNLIKAQVNKASNSLAERRVISQLSTKMSQLADSGLLSRLEKIGDAAQTGAHGLSAGATKVAKQLSGAAKVVDNALSNAANSSSIVRIANNLSKKYGGETFTAKSLRALARNTAFDPTLAGEARALLMLDLAANMSAGGYVAYEESGGSIADTVQGAAVGGALGVAADRLLGFGVDIGTGSAGSFVSGLNGRVSSPSTRGIDIGADSVVGDTRRVVDRVVSDYMTRSGNFVGERIEGTPFVGNAVKAKRTFARGLIDSQSEIFRQAKIATAKNNKSGGKAVDFMTEAMYRTGEARDVSATVSALKGGAGVDSLYADFAEKARTYKSPDADSTSALDRLKKTDFDILKEDFKLYLGARQDLEYNSTLKPGSKNKLKANRVTELEERLQKYDNETLRELYDSTTEVYRTLNKVQFEEGLMTMKDLEARTDSFDYAYIQRELSEDELLRAQLDRQASSPDRVNKIAATERVGSSKEILDPLETLEMFTTKVAKDINTNKLNRFVIKTMEVAGEKPVKVVKGREVGPGEKKVKLYNNGELDEYIVDEAVHSALQVFPEQAVRAMNSGFWNMMRRVNRLSKFGKTTYNVTFGWITNPIRDILQATLTGTRLPVIDLLAIPFETAANRAGLRADDVTTSMMYSAKVGNRANITYLYRNEAPTRRKLRKDVGKQQKVTERITSNFKHPGDMVEAITDGAENVLGFTESWVRMAEFRGAYKKAIKSGLPQEQAMKHATVRSKIDTADFSRIGSTMTYFNLLIPFSNAAVQGTRSVFTALRQRPVTTTARITAAVTAGTYITQMSNDTPEKQLVYAALPQWAKDSNFILVTDGAKWNEEKQQWEGVISIPKPQWLIPLLSPMEKSTAYAMQTDESIFSAMKDYVTEEPDEVIKGMISGWTILDVTSADKFISSTLGSIPILGTVADIYEGKDLYTGRELNFNEATDGSPTFNAIRKIPGLENTSDDVIEAYLFDFTGTTGRNIVNIVDRIAGSEDPQGRPVQNPLTRDYYDERMGSLRNVRNEMNDFWREDFQDKVLGTIYDEDLSKEDKDRLISEYRIEANKLLALKVDGWSAEYGVSPNELFRLPGEQGDQARRYILQAFMGETDSNRYSSGSARDVAQQLYFTNRDTTIEYVRDVFGWDLSSNPLQVDREYLSTGTRFGYNDILDAASDLEQQTGVSLTEAEMQTLQDKLLAQVGAPIEAEAYLDEVTSTDQWRADTDAFYSARSQAFANGTTNEFYNTQGAEYIRKVDEVIRPLIEQYGPAIVMKDKDPVAERVRDMYELGVGYNTTYDGVTYQPSNKKGTKVDAEDFVKRRLGVSTEYNPDSYVDVDGALIKIQKAVDDGKKGTAERLMTTLKNQLNKGTIYVDGSTAQSYRELNERLRDDG